MLLTLPQLLDADELRQRARAAGARALGRRPRERRRPGRAGQEQRAAAARQRRARAACRRWCCGRSTARRVPGGRAAAQACSRRASTATRGDSNRYGQHVDNAVRFTPKPACACAPTSRARSSCPTPTTTTAANSWSTSRGAARSQAGRRRRVLYPGTSVHEVTPVTRGERLAALLLDRKHGAQRRAAPPAARAGPGADARCASSAARAPRPSR